MALIGCNQTLVKKGWVASGQNGATVMIRCVHGDVKTYPIGETTMEVKGKKAHIKVGFAPTLPYDVVLGRLAVL